MKKGVIMEINSKYITLLTREGEFLKTKNQKQDYEIGQEITFFPSYAFSSNKSRIFQINKLRLMVASSLAIMLVFLSFFPYYLNNRVYAYMSIDINPSIELGVNHNLEVVSLEAYNVEGKEIVDDIKKWEKKSIEDVTNSIIQEFEQDGYLEKGNSVLITTTVMNEDDKVEEKKLEKKIEQISTNFQDKDITIEAVSTNKEQRKEAKDKGISTGQLLKIENKLPNDKKKEKVNKAKPKMKEKNHKNENHRNKFNSEIKNNKQDNKQYLKNENKINKNHEKHQKKTAEKSGKAVKEGKQKNKHNKKKSENKRSMNHQ